MPVIQKTIQELSDNPLLLKKYSKDELSNYFEELIKGGNVDSIDSFLKLPFPKNKEVGVHLWNQKSNSFSYYESYTVLALTHRKKSVFEFFQQQHPFDTKIIIYSLCADNNIEMLDYILNKFPPENFNEDNNMLLAALNDNYIEQFRLLTTHPNLSLSIVANDYQLLKKACEQNKEDFVAVLMIDCNMPLNQKMRDWLAGDNINEVVYPFPSKLEILRELNQKLHNTSRKDNDIIKDKLKNKI